MTESAVKTAKFIGAFESELNQLSTSDKVKGWFVQQHLFPHEGTLQLTNDKLLLDPWLEISRESLEDVSLEFTQAYGRLMAAGTRGNVPTFGWIGDLGKPLILLRGTKTDPVYLLIEFRWLTGINQNKEWYELIRRWLNEGGAYPETHA